MRKIFIPIFLLMVVTISAQNDYVNTPQYYQQFTTRLSHHLNIGISQKFLKGALTVSAQLTDVFNTRKWEIFSDNQYYQLDNMLGGHADFGAYMRVATAVRNSGYGRADHIADGEDECTGFFG